MKLFDRDGNGSEEITAAVGIISNGITFDKWRPLIPFGIRDVVAIVGREPVEALSEFYESGDWAEYAVKVHALKSTSLTIGAELLSEQAKALEQAGKKGDTDYIRQNHPPLLALYDQVCGSIAGLLERQEETPGVEKMV